MKYFACVALILALCSCRTIDPRYDPVEIEKRAERARALKADEERAKRCRLVFDQLRRSLKRGMNSKEAAAALGEIPWLDESTCYRQNFLGGWLPVDFGPEIVFGMLLYSNEDDWSDHRVYFSLSGKEKYWKSFTIQEFLRGEVAHDKFRIHQFALCHPTPEGVWKQKIELYPKGSGKKETCFLEK